VFGDTNQQKKVVKVVIKIMAAYEKIKRKESPETSTPSRSLV
jgi:hypothetical protein